MELVTSKFKSGGLHKKHVVATWNLGNHLSICLQTQGNQEKPVSRWLVAGTSEYWILASSPASKVKKQQCSKKQQRNIARMCKPPVVNWPGGGGTLFKRGRSVEVIVERRMGDGKR